MNTKIFYPVLLFLLLASCNRLEVTPSASEAPLDLAPVSLEQGISPLLTAEQLKRFEPAEIRALDQFVINPFVKLENREATTIRIPGGSVDALADAIARATEGGTIVLESGTHTASATIMVDKPIRIEGAPGSVLEVSTLPAEAVGYLQPAIHVKNARGVTISKLNLVSANPIGGTGILVEDAPRTVLVGNTLSGHQHSVVIENSDRCWIAFNTLNTSNAWATGDIAFAFGLININGERNGILGNTFTGGFLGTFISDEDGLYIGNEMYGNVIGSLLCTVTPLVFPDQSVHQAGTPCEDWLYVGNSAHDNFNIGYLIIDGANKNDLQGNKAANNAAYDIELAGESMRFGFLTPESYDNRVVARENITVKDCGSGNKVIGGATIDTAADPCF